MLGREVGAVIAAFASPGVALLEVDLVVVAVAHPDLEHALDVHLDHVLAGQAVLGKEQFVEDRVVEALRAEQPDVELDWLAHLADLAGPHHRSDRRLTAHADEREVLQALLLGVFERERVGRVRVAAAGPAEHFVLVGGEARHGLPGGAVTIEEARERAVDDAVVEAPDEDGRHEAAVLAGLVHVLVGGADEHDVAVDADHLVGLARPAEEVLVGLRLPLTEAWAGAGAAGAALLAVDAVVGAELILEVEGLVLARLVVVADDVVRARDDAPGAPGAQAAGDHLGEQFLPLEGPAFGLLRNFRRIGHGHDGTLPSTSGFGPVLLGLCAARLLG